jgi:hypothetical protein
LEWGWSTEVVTLLTTTPANIAHWRRTGVTPPPRQERRMVEIARKMRWDPWLLTDPDIIRASVRPRDPRHDLHRDGHPVTEAGPDACRIAG